MNIAIFINNQAVPAAKHFNITVTQPRTFMNDDGIVTPSDADMDIF